MSGNITFHPLPGAAKDVAVDVDGSIWVIGATPVNSAGDFGVLRFNGTSFDPVEGLAGVRIAIAPDGRGFVINSKGPLFIRDLFENYFAPLPQFLVRDIAGGRDGSTWAIGTNLVGTSGDFRLFQSTPGDFVPVLGGGVSIAVGPDNLPLVVNSRNQILKRIPSPDLFTYELIPGGASAVSAGGDGSIWIIGPDQFAHPQDTGVFALGPEDQDFKPLPVAGVRLTVKFEAFVINLRGQLLKSEFSPAVGHTIFLQFSSMLVKDIAIGSTFWVLGDKAVNMDGDFGLFQFAGTLLNPSFVPVPGGVPGIRIAAGGGFLAVLNSKGQVFRGTETGAGLTFVELQGTATDIGVGGDGSIWAIGTTHVGTAADFNILRVNGTTFEPVEGGIVHIATEGGGRIDGGGAIRIAVDGDGLPVVINSFNEILRSGHGSFQPFPGEARHVVIGFDNSIWAIGTDPLAKAADFDIARFDGTRFESLDGVVGLRMAVGADGLPVVVNSSNQILRGTLSPP